ncbi:MULTISPECIES: hypothetical protein [Trichocoleus]|uniref:Uncharacterized protein n=1 Tax=Trichocoleus desertorum GB2-A4 TaxID=2933944 RepID=A0ABV0JEQ1_9CYAN|nr:hypothetical protein [Trichocoleus sp. FACHB-46]MBD1865494.1 hypothetical protein [Trichocoleus sp. FACHB-46]
MAFVDLLTHLCILRRRAAGNRPAEIEIDDIEIAPGKTDMKAVRFTKQVEI